VLEAGRRAEGEGKLDYAVQFYRHLATYYPTAPEAAAAREGLARLAPKHAGAAEAIAALGVAAGPAPVAAPLAPAPSPPAPPPQPRPVAPAPTTYANGADHGAMHARPSGAGRPSYGVGPGRETGHAAHVVASAMPEPIDRYRAGRWLSRIFTAVGTLAMIGGLCAVLLWVLAALAPKAVGYLGTNLMLISMVGHLVGPSLIVTGIVLVHWGQIGRAVLDTANASQDLVAIERAKAGD
jgi:hypothetical protein